MEPIKSRRNPYLVLLYLLMGLAVGILVSLALGRYPILPNQLWDLLWEGIRNSASHQLTPAQAVLLRVRLPRIFLAVLVGAALSAAGATYQGIFQNPMASPDMLGASSGAGFGAALAILLDQSRQMVSIWAFICSLGGLGLVWVISSRAKGRQIFSLILTGMIVSALFSAGISLLKLVADPANQLPAITYWLMGSLSGAQGADLIWMGGALLLGMVPLLLFRWQMNLLTLSEEEAHSIGVPIQMVRMVLICSATLLTAASVAVSGLIGWIGLVIPHLARRLTGDNFRYLLPASALTGGLFLLLVDNISRNLLSTEIPIGILTAFVGAPFFLYLILYRGEEL